MEKEDYLEADSSVPGQNWVCLSFVSPEKLLHGLGIPHIGSEISELLLLNFKNINNIFDSSEENILEIDGIGPKIYESLKDWIQVEKNIILLKNLENIGFDFTTQNTQRVQRALPLGMQREGQ